MMVKTALPYLDILFRVKERFGVPTFAYQVSGEYAMVIAVAETGFIDGSKAMLVWPPRTQPRHATSQ